MAQSMPRTEPHSLCRVRSPTVYAAYGAPPHSLCRVSTIRVTMIVLLPVMAYLLAGACATAPAGCTETAGLYECDFATVSMPMSASSFSNPSPQRIRIVDINADFSTSMFNADFLTVESGASFEANFPATLELKCSPAMSSTFDISSGSLANMGYIYDLKIINCDLGLGANALSGLGTLDRLIIENGTIQSIDATAFTDVTIEKPANLTHDFYVKTGELVIRDSKVASGALPDTLLSGQSGIVSLTLEGLEVSSISSSMFSDSTKLRFLSLGHNALTELPSGLLDGLDSLAELHLYSTELDCSCEQLWMYSESIITRMKIFGDVICQSPAAYLDKKAVVYYYTECVAEVETCTGGITLLGACITWMEIGLSSMCFIAFVLAMVVFILVLVTKKKLVGAGGAGGKNKTSVTASVTNKKKPGRKQGWN
ncbi:uncharacterized protein LOC128246328 [Mya arenaria]|uniref:uncharacterized protein LOC128246328 n=1 Tax=Mya arenaria TaxID=6604 RepID=UPI0022E013F4|nr:uncharacterized protein LOC128246328 [Mya arenaria]